MVKVVQLYFVLEKQMVSTVNMEQSNSKPCLLPLSTALANATMASDVPRARTSRAAWRSATTLLVTSSRARALDKASSISGEHK